MSLGLKLSLKNEICRQLDLNLLFIEGGLSLSQFVFIYWAFLTLFNAKESGITREKKDKSLVFLKSHDALI